MTTVEGAAPASDELDLGAEPWTVITPSAVRRFRDCPRSYLLRHVLNVPVPAAAGDAVGLGDRVHEELALRHEDGLDRHDAAEICSEGFPDRRILAAVGAHHSCCPSREGAAYEAGEQSLAWFWRRSDQRVVLSGRVDARWRLPDGTVEVREYKTGGRSTHADHSLAVDIYGLLVAADEYRRGRRPTQVIVGIEHLGATGGAVLDRSLLSVDDLRGAAARLRSVAEALRHEKSFLPTPAYGRCDRCDHRHLCPVSATSPGETADPPR